MILVDRNIKEMVKTGNLISDGYDEKNVNSISYDLILGEFIDTQKKERDIAPGEYIMIKTREELCIPNNITGRVGEKNSLLRMGLKVDGPQYQPGHKTYCFLRVENISPNVITMHVGMAIAQIYFEELKEVPEITYDRQVGASFQNESRYVGFGKYESEYSKNIKSFQSIKDDIEGMSNKIYGNVLTLMGIIVAIFSLLTINYQAFTEADLSLKYIIAMNLSLTFCILVMMGAILLLINKCKKKGFTIIYAAILVVLFIVTLLFCVGIL